MGTPTPSNERSSRALLVRIAIAVGVIVIIVAVVAVVNRGNDDNKDSAASGGAKLVALNELSHADFVVYPTGDDVRSGLDGLSTVDNYALLAAKTLPTKPSTGQVHDAACALLDRQGLIVQAQPGTSAGEIAGIVGTRGRVFDLFPHDIEVFMKTSAPRAQADAAQKKIAATNGVDDATLVDRKTAYEEFQKTYADQPSVLSATAEADVPESVRVTVSPGTSIDTLRTQFGKLAGVDVALQTGQLQGQAYDWRLGPANPADCNTP